MFEHRGNVVITSLQGSAVTQTVLDEQTIIIRLPISYSACVSKIMKIGWQWTKLLQKLAGLLFWPTLYMRQLFAPFCASLRITHITTFTYQFYEPQFPVFFKSR